MANKFDSIKTDKAEDTGIATDSVFTAVERGGRESRKAVASPEEQARRRREMKTQGKKGCELKRITIAFSDPNYDYVRTMAGLQGESITRFINEVLDAHRKKNGKVFEEAQAIAERVKK